MADSLSMLCSSMSSLAVLQVLTTWSADLQQRLSAVVLCVRLANDAACLVRVLVTRTCNTAAFISELYSCMGVYAGNANCAWC